MKYCGRRSDWVDENRISIVSVNMLSRMVVGWVYIYVYTYIYILKKKKKDFHLGLEALRAAPSGEHR